MDRRAFVLSRHRERFRAEPLHVIARSRTPSPKRSGSPEAIPFMRERLLPEGIALAIPAPTGRCGVTVTVGYKPTARKG